MNHTARRIVVAFGVMITSLLVLAALTEVALELRSKVLDQEVVASSAPGFRVLMIGDSVLGFINQDPKGLAGRLKAAAPAGIVISEVSAPALLTKPLAEKSAALASATKPDLVILMVGKSDYDAALTESPQGIQNLRTIRLARFIWGDLNLRYMRWTALEELRNSRKQRLAAAWAAYAKLDCMTAVPLFAGLLDERHDSPTDEPNGRAIYDCYLREKTYADGAKFFSDLASKSKDGSVFRMYAGSLKIQGGANDPKIRKEAHLEIEQAVATGEPRSAFKTRLWLAKTDHDAVLFASTLKNMRVSDSAVMDRRTIENIRTVIAAFVDKNIHVILMQYPTDHIDVWKNNFAEFGDKISFISLREWLIEQPENEIMLDVDDDIEHLTPAGADKLAPRLMKEIEARYQKRR
ncbi:hypothetical protein BH10BDE1_BH10BDE1_33440 [soil metagenome]